MTLGGKVIVIFPPMGMVRSPLILIINCAYCVMVGGLIKTFEEIACDCSSS